MFAKEIVLVNKNDVLANFAGEVVKIYTQINPNITPSSIVVLCWAVDSNEDICNRFYSLCDSFGQNPLKVMANTLNEVGVN